MFVSSTLRGDCSLFFVLLSVFLCCSVFDLLSYIAPVFCACFPAPVFLFLVVRCLSDCLLALSSLSLSSVGFAYCFDSPVSIWSLSGSLMCLSSHLELVYFLFCLLTSFLRLFSLLSFLQLSWGLFFFSFLAVGSGLFCLLSSLCSPFFAAVALPCACSGFPISIDCSVLILHSMGIILVCFWCLCLGVLLFSSVGLLCMGFVYPYSIVACSYVSCHPSLSYLALGFAFLVFLVSFFLRLLSDHSLLLGASLSTLLLPSGCVCSLVTCFAFLRVFSPGLCSVLSRSSCSLAWSFLAAVLFLLCFGTLLAIVFSCVFSWSSSPQLSPVCFYFSPFSCFRGVCPTSSGLPLGPVPVVRVRFLFFGIGFMFSVVFPFILFWYARLLLLSSDLLGFASFVGFAFPVVPAIAPPFLYPLVFAFLHAAVRAAPCGLSQCFFSTCCGFG